MGATHGKLDEYHPIDKKNISPGSDVEFSVKSTGSYSQPPVSYSWERKKLGEGWIPLPTDSDDRIAGKNNATLTIHRIRKSDEGMYRCTVSFKGDERQLSRDATLTVDQPPEITTQPKDQKDSLPGDNAIFYIKASGTEPMQYSWQQKPATGDRWERLTDDNNFEGVNSAKLTVLRVQKAHEGQYRCVLWNKLGRERSQAVTLTIAVPPQIVSPPKDCINVSPNTPVKFSVTASGTEPLKYTWEYQQLHSSWQKISTTDSRFQGVDSAALTIAEVRKSDEGRYRCIVSNLANLPGKASESALLCVADPPMIETQPNNQRDVVPEGCAVFIASASGTEPLQYSWEFKPFEDENQSDCQSPLSSSTTASEHEGGGGSGTVSFGGQKFTFAIANVERKPNLADNWQPLCTDSGKYIGVNSSELAVHGIQKSDEGNYRCTVTNTAGKAASSTVELTVLDIDIFMAKACDEGDTQGVIEMIEHCKPESKTAQKALMAVVQLDREHPDFVEVLLSCGVQPDFTEDGWTPLQCACSKGYSKIALELLNKGANKDVETEDRRNLLHLAVENGRNETTRVLLFKEVDVNTQDKEQRTPLCAAIEAVKNLSSERAPQQLEVITNLQKNGARLDIPDKHQRTPLHVATSLGKTDIVKMLLERKDIGWQCINYRDRDLETALHLACRYGHQEIAKLLLQKGADVTIPNKDGNVPVDLAVIAKHPDLQRIEGLAPKKWSGSILRSGKSRAHSIYVKQDIGPDSEHPNISRPRSATCIAPTTHQAHSGIPQDVNRAKGKAASNAIQKYFDTLVKHVKPQAIAPSLFTKSIISSEALEKARNGHFTEEHRAQELLQDVMRKVESRPGWFDDVCEILHKDSVTVVEHIRADYQRTAQLLEGQDQLQKACSEMHLELVRTVVQRCGPNSEFAKQALFDVLNSKTGKQLNERERQQLTEALIEAGVPSEFVLEGKTPLQCACSNGDLTVALYLLKKGANKFSRTQDKKTLLHLTCENLHHRVLAPLLAQHDLKILIDEQDIQGRTALHVVCEAAEKVLSTKDLDASQIGMMKMQLPMMVKNLMDDGTDVTIQDVEKNTPLHIASLKGSSDIVKVLLESDVLCSNIDMTNMYGNTALHIAARSGFSDVVGILTQKCADISITNLDNKTPADLARKNGHTRLAQKLRGNHTPRILRVKPFKAQK